MNKPKKTSLRKLAVNKETLRHLTADNLKKVIGASAQGCEQSDANKGCKLTGTLEAGGRV